VRGLEPEQVGDAGERVTLLDFVDAVDVRVRGVAVTGRSGALAVVAFLTVLAFVLGCQGRRHGFTGLLLLGEQSGGEALLVRVAAGEEACAREVLVRGCRHARYGEGGDVAGL